MASCSTLRCTYLCSGSPGSDTAIDKPRGSLCYIIIKELLIFHLNHPYTKNWTYVAPTSSPTALSSTAVYQYLHTNCYCKEGGHVKEKKRSSERGPATEMLQPNMILCESCDLLYQHRGQGDELVTADRFWVQRTEPQFAYLNKLLKKYLCTSILQLWYNNHIIFRFLQ